MGFEVRLEKTTYSKLWFVNVYKIDRNVKANFKETLVWHGEYTSFKVAAEVCKCLAECLSAIKEQGGD